MAMSLKVFKSHRKGKREGEEEGETIGKVVDVAFDSIPMENRKHHFA